MRFRQWFEAQYSDDLSNLEGEPYIDVEWNRNLHLTYRWKGYQTLPHQRGYAKEDEFGSLTLEPEDDGYFYVDGVDVAEPFRREGYATRLYQKALELIKGRGFKGIRSYKANRRPGDGADELWATLATRSDDEADYMESTGSLF